MKKIFLSLLSILVLTAEIVAAQSTPFLKARIPYGSYETLVKSVDLPDDENFKLDDGQFFDLGYKYTYFHIVFLPLWVDDEGQAIVGITEDGESYIDLNEENIAFIKEQGIEVPTEVSPSFWHSIGGKLVVLLILGGVLFFKLRGGDDEEEEEEKPEPETPQQA